MARLIPNEKTYVCFVPSDAADPVSAITAPTVAEAAGGTDLSGFIVSLNASSTGNTLPTPEFSTLFETSIPGTVSAQFSADFYRDDATDTAWDALPRAKEGHFIISRFGGSGTDNLPVENDEVEVWPVTVTSRTMQNMASNSVMMFSVQCSVPVEPEEAVLVVA